MPSEKRRQRQQRIRHEAGDAITNISTSTNKCKEPDHGPENNPSSVSLVDRPTPIKNVSVVNSGNEHNPEQKDIKKMSSISNEKNLSFESKVNDKGGISGRRDRKQFRSEGMAVPKHTVAFEEQKEYKSVKIMPASNTCENESSDAKKYRRREVVSNWLRYEELPLEDIIVDGEDYMLGEDFSDVLKLHGNTSTGGFLHLKGEMSWGDVNPSHLGMHGLGALKIADLADALATIPLHQQLRIPEESLPLHNIQIYNAEAETQKLAYQPDREYVTDIELDEAIFKNLKLSISDTFNSSEEATCDYQRSLDASVKFSSAFLDQTDNNVDCNNFSHKNILDLTSEPNVTSEEKFVGEKEIDSNNMCSESKQNPLPVINNGNNFTSGSVLPKSELEEPDNVPRIHTMTNDKITSNSSNFNFGLPPKTNDNYLIKKSANHHGTLTDTAESEIINRYQNVGEIVEEPISVQDSKDDIAEIKEEIPEPKMKDPVSLISKTEIESLEDWLDSVLDD